MNFIDLDMKPLKKMEYYYELDKKILNCYTQMVKMEHEEGNTLSMEVYEATNWDSTIPSNMLALLKILLVNAIKYGILFS